MKKFRKLVTVLMLVVTFLLLRAYPVHSKVILVLALATLLAVTAFMADKHKRITAEERTMNFRFLLGIRRPEETKKRIFQFVGFLLCFVAPILLFLYIGAKYVLLDERLYYELGYVLIVCFFASFLIPALNRGFRDYPLWMSLAARAGGCLPVVAALFSMALAFNCVKNDSVRTRDVVCLGKRPTLGSNPVYYVRVRPWPSSVREVEVEVPGEVFAALRPGSELRITTGVGRLGAEWIRRVDVVQPK